MSDDDDDRAFLLKTAQECREQADRAARPDDRARWLEMAEMFFARARELENN